VNWFHKHTKQFRVRASLAGIEASQRLVASLRPFIAPASFFNKSNLNTNCGEFLQNDLGTALSYLREDEWESHSFLGRGTGPDWMDDVQSAEVKCFTPDAFVARTSRAEAQAAPAGAANYVDTRAA
jgi:hypothetical protein